MSKHLSFETGSEFPVAYRDDQTFIPLPFIHDLSMGFQDDTLDFFTKTAHNTNLVSNATLQASKQAVPEKTMDNFLEAFTDGATVALGIASINLRIAHGAKDSDIATIELLLKHTTTTPSPANTVEALEKARNSVITRAQEKYGFSAVRILGALKQAYGIDSEKQPQDQDPTATRQMAALGFAVVAPLIEQSIKQYRRFLAEVERMTER